MLFLLNWVNLLQVGFPQLWRAEAGTPPLSSAWASRSCCAAQGLGAQAPAAAGRELRSWGVHLVAPWHAGFSRTRAHTCVPCVHRWILNLWITREVQIFPLSWVRMSLFSFPLRSELLVLRPLDSEAYACGPLVLRPLQSDWITPLALLTHQLVDGQLWDFLASITDWTNAVINVLSIRLSIHPIGSFSLEN